MSQSSTLKQILSFISYFAEMFESRCFSYTGTEIMDFLFLIYISERFWLLRIWVKRENSRP